MPAQLPPWVHIREVRLSDAPALAKVHMYSRAVAYRDFTPAAELARLPSQYDAFVEKHRAGTAAFTAVPRSDRTGLILVAVGTPPQTTSTPVAGGARWEDGVDERIVGYGAFRMIDPDDERGGAAFVFPADPQVVGAARAMAARGEGRLLEVAGIHFVPEAHGTGIAQHMWGMAARWALTEMGARATVVLTVRDNTRAVEFYRRKMKATGEVEFTKVFLGKEQSEVLFKYDHAAMLEHATLCE